uniref:Uncharacterized protein n=1 Tax=viral metagenome TaxID=1070528 RepID=A0A6M3L573_9ZZZZ
MEERGWLPMPVEGCKGCSTTGGVYSCPEHSPNTHIRKLSYPSIQCPHCGKDIVVKEE